MIHRLTPHQSLFPTALQIVQPAVQQLWVRGNIKLLQQPAVAVVGSRSLTSYGRQATEELAGHLARTGVVVVSGLALGVDSVAHRAALVAGGLTIAVLPGGIERIYPASHQRLADDILAQGGALVSEYAGRQLPHRHHFIARNRLIAGLSRAILITEAASKSGSLHTAQFALEQGKDVLAVPGSIFNPQSAGTNHLIEQGAQIVENAKHLLSLLQIEPSQLSLPALKPSEARLLAMLKAGHTSSADLLVTSQLGVAELNQSLTSLELRDVIQRYGSHWQIKKI